MATGKYLVRVVVNGVLIPLYQYQNLDWAYVQASLIILIFFHIFIMMMRLFLKDSNSLNIVYLKKSLNY